jgi:hypothetical protein
MEALSSSETSILTRAARRNIPEDAILHSHRRENLKAYVNFEFSDILPQVYTGLQMMKHIVTYTRCGSVTNNATRAWIGYRIYSLWRFTITNGYNYKDHYSTGSFSDPIDGTALS